MEQYSVTVDKQYLQFCCAHFITFHGTRERLHGHNYHCSVHLEGVLGSEGYVVDFADVKRAARAACDALDHRVLLPAENAEIHVERAEGTVMLRYRADRFVLPADDVLILPISNTTSEQLARCLADDIVSKLGGEALARLTSITVSVEEAPGQRAEFQRSLDYRPRVYV